ncbi:hypothetical protein ACOZE3_11930 [Streptomyces cinereoruber]|uniref:hypothetical protein n=1 Tax=Streptomyces cinereoruber TaxID=67260 RepID=UPI003BF53F51
MNEHSDPSLRALFRAAAEHGSREAATLPVARVVERGRRAHRRRLALGTATAGVVAVLGLATAVSLAPGPAGPALPATSPSDLLPRETASTAPPTPDSTTTTEGRRTHPPTTSGRTTPSTAPPATATTRAATTTPPQG